MNSMKAGAETVDDDTSHSSSDGYCEAEEYADDIDTRLVLILLIPLLSKTIGKYLVTLVIRRLLS